MNSSRAAITVNRGRDEVQRRWSSDGTDAPVAFVDAPGDRGTEIHAETTGPLEQLKDDLRRFKQLAETGVIARSEASPEGARTEGLRKQRPAQPLTDIELQKAGV
jgi:hypothetical protein